MGAVEVAKTLGSKSSRFEDGVPSYMLYDEVEETPDQCAVKEKLNVRKTINSFLGHRRQSEALKTQECDKGCCPP